MKKFNFIASLLLLFVSTVMFTACSDNDHEPDPETSNLVGTWESSFEEMGGTCTMTFTINDDHTFNFKSVIDDEIDDLFDGEWTFDESRKKITFKDSTDPYGTTYHTAIFSKDYKSFIITWDEDETVYEYPFYKK